MPPYSNSNVLRPGHHYQKFSFHQQQEALSTYFDLTYFQHGLWSNMCLSWIEINNGPYSKFDQICKTFPLLCRIVYLCTIVVAFVKCHYCGSAALNSVGWTFEFLSSKNSNITWVWSLNECYSKWFSNVVD